MAEGFVTQVMIPGAAGLNIHRALDEVNTLQLTRMNNVVRPQEGALTGRQGIATIATTTTLAEHHTIGRLNDRLNNTYLRLLGVGTEVWGGTTGAFSLLDSGYSGNPLSMVQYHPPISNDTWMLIGDSSKMRKIRASDSLVLQLGLPEPPNPDARFWIDEWIALPHAAGLTSRDLMQGVSTWLGFNITSFGPGLPGELTTYDALYKKEVNLFTIFANSAWINRQGSLAGVGTSQKDTGIVPPGSTASMKFKTHSGGNGYNFWAYDFSNASYSSNTSFTLNLDQLLSGTGGTKDGNDQDIFNLWMRVDKPEQLVEARIYFVCSKNFDSLSIPGVADSPNTDAFVHSYRANDLTGAFQVDVNMINGAQVFAGNLQTIQQLPPPKDKRPRAKLPNSQTPQASKQTNPGIGWTNFGSVGIPLHRIDFQRIGSDDTRGWSTITGIIVVVNQQTTSAEPTAQVTLWLSDFFLRGGAGLDTSLVGLTSYDYRVTNYDPRTGAESNPSEIQGDGFQLDSLRQGIIVSPPAFGDSAIRQRFYRRGGSLNNNWYFLGVNGSDGGTFLDEASDASIVSSATLNLDNYQPVATVDTDGTTIKAQPIKAIWGPVNDIVFGCGDPHRAGTLYWCKPTNIDSWPSSFNVEVCSPSEELMMGCAYGGQAWVFSRERMFVCLPNLNNAGQVTVNPTQCMHGLVSRLGLAVGAGAIFFVSKDGIYRTVGGTEENIADHKLRPLFYGQTVNGYLPIDYSVPEAIKLQVFENEVWFTFRDTGGTNRCYIYSTLYDYWRIYNFVQEHSVAYAEDGTSTASLLIGGRNQTTTDNLGHTYQHAGGTIVYTDDGQAIPYEFRTGSLDQGMPRENKLYGDLMIDVDRAGTTITGTAYLNTESSSVPLESIVTGTGRTRYYLTGLADVQARNIGLDFSGEYNASPPIYYKIGPSYTPQADTATARYTNWDAQGNLSDKYIKGIIIEVDTQGQTKSVNIQADLATQATITVNPTGINGRHVEQFSFTQFRGRLLRLAPNDEVSWIVYQYRWIFDDEPLALTHWETQLIDNGIPLEQTPIYSKISLASLADVTLTLTAVRQDGSTNVQTYTITSTAGAKIPKFVPFQAQKGYLFKYQFDSASPFWLYREESQVYVMPWGGKAAVPTSPFGSDDLDKVRKMQEAGLAGVVDRWSQSSASYGTTPSDTTNTPGR